MSTSIALFIIAVIVAAVVVPLFVIFHYITRWKQIKALTENDEEMLSDLWENAATMEQRIVTLEKILDEERPGWRGRHNEEF